MAIRLLIRFAVNFPEAAFLKQRYGILILSLALSLVYAVLRYFVFKGTCLSRSPSSECVTGWCHWN